MASPVAPLFSSSSIAGGRVRRWSLSQLAGLEPSSMTAQTMLEEVTSRLELQTMTCETLMEETEPLSSSSTTTSGNLVQRQLHFLHHVHVDTAEQCRQLLERRKQVWLRWSNTDQRMVRKCLEQVRDRHAPSLERLVDVAIALRNNSEHDEETKRRNANHLDHLLQGRLSIQLLAHHYSLLAHEEERRRRTTGAISENHPLADLVHDAYTEAHFLCEAHYQRAPDLKLNVSEDLTATVVRPWLTHILVEICKNGMCSTVQRHFNEPKMMGHEFYDDEDLPPPLVVTAHEDPAQNSDMITLRVRDHGVGLPDTSNPENSHDMDLFGWGTSSSSKRWDRIKEQQTYAAVRPPLASLGVGLPLSRTMLRQFGGDLELFSHSSNGRHGSGAFREGIEDDSPFVGGCTAQIKLPKTTDIDEVLPPHFAEWEDKE